MHSPSLLTRDFPVPANCKLRSLEQSYFTDHTVSFPTELPKLFKFLKGEEGTRVKDRERRRTKLLVLEGEEEHRNGNENRNLINSLANFSLVFDEFKKKSIKVI